MTPIWFLNLARSTDRRQHMEAQLANLGLGFERVDAIDAHALGDTALRALAWPAAFRTHPWLGRPMTTSEIGCALTHANAWQRVAAGSSGVVILEDDVNLSPRFRAAVEGLSDKGESFDLVLLGHHSSRRPWQPEAPPTHEHGALTTFRGRTLAPGIAVARLVEYAQGAYGYFVTPAAAAALLRFALPIRMPADTVTGYAPRAGVASWAVTSPCVVPTPRFPTTMTEPRPCSCRVCAQARMAGLVPADHREGAAGAGSPSGFAESVRALGGRALLLSRRLGLRPGGFWAPSFDLTTSGHQ